MRILKLANREIKTEKKAFVMGILNVTPDSFWNKSCGGLRTALKLIEDGADILDIGAESSRPGSRYVDSNVELKRIIPIIKKIRKYSNIPISIDTRKSEVLSACLEEGADILNDISSLEDDDNLGKLCAKWNIPVILMHKRNIPLHMQKNTYYEDIFKDVESYLFERIDYALKCGISSDKIIIDPGIGFGKDTNGNCVLVKHCGQLCGGRYPVLMALSRKSFLGSLTNRDVKDRLSSTITANILSIMNGASIIRVHDVKEAVDSLSILNSIEYCLQKEE